MDVEAELLTLSKEVSRHIGVMEGFVAGQTKTNDTLTACLTKLADEHQKIKKEVFTIKSKVAFAASCVGTAVAVGWNWLLKKMGIDA